MEDFEETQTDFDLTDANDRRVYDTRYLQKIKELSGELNAEEKDDIFDQMHSLNYNASNSPENDAHLNFLRSQNIAKQKNRFDPHTESLLRSKAEMTGKPLAQVKKEARAYLKGGK